MSEQMTKTTLDQTALAQFTGTDNWYKHGLVPGVTYTDGVKYVAETAGAYWLIDKVATLQYLPKVKAEEFQVWRLVVKDSAGTLSCEDGNGRVVYSEAIQYTDFPEPGIDLWCEQGEQRVILLPSEH